MPLHGISLGEFPANIYTFITHGPTQASITDTLLIRGLSPRLYLYSIYHVPIPSKLIVAIHESYFFPYMIFEYRHNIKIKNYKSYIL